MTAVDPIPTRAAPAFDRRGFLDALLAVGFVSTAIAIAYPVSQFLIPPASGEPATASAGAGKAAALKPNSARIFKFGSRPGIVVRTADGDVRAFSAVCTHLDCTVQYKPDTAAALVRLPQRHLRPRRQRRVRAAASRPRAVRRQPARRAGRRSDRRVARLTGADRTW